MSGWSLLREHLSNFSFGEPDVLCNVESLRLILPQAYGFEPDVNFTVHLSALSKLLRARGESKYKTTNLGRIILNMLVMSVIFKTQKEALLRLS